jgi:DNA polymerase-3 subunit alpha
MQYIPSYAARKNGREPVTYIDERLKAITGDSYGICIYQEQYMQIAKELAGFTPAEAETLRKAIGKKNREAMAQLKPEFMSGCQANGVAPSVAEALWSTNEKSADYSFNKSHAACYALIAYRTAWLKANHPAEYMAALISSVMDTKDKVPFFVNRTEQMGIEILPPDVNLSDHEFVVVDGNIRFGLRAVKGVGTAAIDAIKQAREEGGPFSSLWDFCSRVDCRAVNKKAIEALIKCGAFGSTGASRKGMLSVLEQAQGAGAQAQQDLAIGQGSIFDLEPAAPATNGAAAAFAPSYPPIPPDEFDQHELLAVEKESIGLFISAHPLKEVREALQEKADYSLAELENVKDGEYVLVGGIITQYKKIRTRSGTTMAFATLDDLDGTVEILLFEKTLLEYEGAVAVDEVVLIKGKVDHKDKDKTCVVVNSVESFRPTPDEVESAREAAALKATGPEPLKVALDASRFAATIIEELKHLFESFPGESEVVLDLHCTDGIRTLRFGPSYRVAPSASLRAELASLLGPSLPPPAAEAAVPEAEPAAEPQAA